MKQSTLALALMGMLCSGALAQNSSSVGVVESPTACIAPAASFHKVNPQILTAILKVESGLKPQAVGRNANGTVDLGIGQINSIHLPELKKYDIGPQDLMQACIGTYVAAWHLSKQYKRYGNTWFAVGAYHSITPEHNMRYQQLVYAQLTKNIL